MKNSKMLLMLAASMATVSANADNNPHIILNKDHIYAEISTNDTSNNGNVLHQVLRNCANNDENFEVNVQLRIKLGALIKETQEAIQQPPYSDNDVPVNAAWRHYLYNRYGNVDERFEEVALENLKALLSGKDNNDKTPASLSKELAGSNGNSEFNALAEFLEDTERKVNETPEERAQRIAREREMCAAMIVLNVISNLHETN